MLGKTRLPSCGLCPCRETEYICISTNPLINPHIVNDVTLHLYFIRLYILLRKASQALTCG